MSNYVWRDQEVPAGLAGEPRTGLEKAGVLLEQNPIPLEEAGVFLERLQSLENAHFPGTGSNLSGESWNSPGTGSNPPGGGWSFPGTGSNLSGECSFSWNRLQSLWRRLGFSWNWLHPPWSSRVFLEPAPSTLEQTGDILTSWEHLGREVLVSQLELLGISVSTK